MLILDENFRRHLEAFASELFISESVQATVTLKCPSRLSNISILLNI